MSEKEVKESVFISAVPKGGVVEIKYEGKKIAERRGSGPLRRF